MSNTYDEQIDEPALSFETAVNLEKVKREFFSGSRDAACDILREYVRDGKVVALRGAYKYADEYEGRPMYIAKNRVNGFERSFQDDRKYALARFCVCVVDSSYVFSSVWFTNSEGYADSLARTADDFVFERVDVADIDTAINEFAAEPSETQYVKYLH